MTLADPKQQQLVADVTRAAEKLDWKTVFDCIDKRGFDIDTRLGQTRRTLVHRAAQLGQVDALQQLYARGAKLEGIHDRDGQDAIHLAAKSNRLPELRWLVQQGVNLESPGDPVRVPRRPFRHGAPANLEEPRLTPLQWATKKGNLPMARLLLDAGADPDGRDFEGNTALMAVARQPLQRSTKQLAGLLLSRGADMDALNDRKESLMMAATYTMQSFSQAEFFADLGAPLDHPQASMPLSDWMRRRPLNIEVTDRFLRGRRDIVQLDAATIESKAALFEPNAQGYAPLDDAANWRRLPEIAQALSDKGQPLSCEDFLKERPDGRNWMVRAVECGAYEPLQSALRAMGEPLQGKDFSDATRAGAPNRLGMIAEDMWLGETVFSQPGHWEGQSEKTLRAFARELPSVLREQFSNVHQLLAAKSMENAQTSRGR